MFDDFDQKTCNEFIDYVYELASESIEDGEFLQTISSDVGMELYLKFNTLENLDDEIIFDLMKKFENLKNNGKN